MSLNLKNETMMIVADLFKQREGFGHGLEQLKLWRDQCKASYEAKEAKEIAEAKLEAQKMKEWCKEFWEAYSVSSPVLLLCMRNGNYEIDKAACAEKLWYPLPKIAVIDWKYPISGAGGDEYGRSHGSYTQRQLLDKLTENMGTTTLVEGDLSDVMSRAVGWLKSMGCDGSTGIIISMTSQGPESQLFRDDNFVPPWREDVRSMGFDGFYQGFPIVWYKKEEREAKDKQMTCDPISKKVVSVDLKGWKGIKARESMAIERVFGELTIGRWTDEEIQKAITDNKLKLENRAKGNCPVEISLHWTLSSCEPPKTMSFEIKRDQSDSNNEVKGQT
jgi:hypothetical protein